jgi:ubiquinone/menaquinone biosynthesis C-methylase UbiE
MKYGLTDPDYLRKDQYKDSSNLSARADLHQLFSTNHIGWHFWVLDQLNIPEKCRILELGCGPGYLWKQNRKRIQSGWDIYLSDISAGMLEEASTDLGNSGTYKHIVHDACKIPFPKTVFDAVIANHMLYHLPDIPAAAKEISRVLKPAGCLYASTNGEAHLKEIRDWKSQFFPEQEGPDWGTPTLRFSIENGEDILRQEFSNIRFLEYPDSLIVDQVEPIIRYIKSYTKLDETDFQTLKLRRYLQNRISENGSIEITKDSGMFIAVKH